MGTEILEYLNAGLTMEPILIYGGGKRRKVEGGMEKHLPFSFSPSPSDLPAKSIMKGRRYGEEQETGTQDCGDHGGWDRQGGRP
jgi:hypothetical protein